MRFIAPAAGCDSRRRQCIPYMNPCIHESTTCSCVPPQTSSMHGPEAGPDQPSCGIMEVFLFMGGARVAQRFPWMAIQPGAAQLLAGVTNFVVHS